MTAVVPDRTAPHTSAASIARRFVASAAPTAVAIAVALVVATRWYLPITQADAVLPALMSTQHMTLFYWGQDRLANVVPLLALPVRDEIWNFRVQSMLIGAAFFGLITIFVRHHLLRVKGRVATVTSAVAVLAAGLLTMTPMRALAGYRFVFEQLYCFGLCVFLLALVVWIRRKPFVLGAAAMQVAMLLNPSLLLLAPFVWLLDFEPSGRTRRTAERVGAMLATFVVTNVCARLFETGDNDQPYDQFRLSELRSGMAAARRSIVESMATTQAVVIVVVVVAVVAARMPSMPPPLRRVYVAAPLFSAAWFVLFSTNEWVRLNNHEFRYFFPLYVTFMLYVAVAVSELLELAVQAVTTVRGPIPTLHAPAAAATATAVAATVVAVALPLFVASRTRVLIFDTIEPSVAAADATGTQLVAGNYAFVWPTVVAGRSEGLDLLGVAYRSVAISDEIDEVVEGAVGTGVPVRVLCTDGVAETCLQDLGLHTSVSAWQLTAVVDDQPLVIDAIPGA